MKATDSFRKTIEAHLQSVAASDPLFAEKMQNENKNIDDCVTYILHWVKAQDCNGFEDNEIFGQAMHYYDEEDIKVGKPIQARVVVNHKVELSEEELQQAKEKAKQQAIDQAIAAEKARLTKRQAAKKEVVAQPSLFD